MFFCNNCWWRPIASHFRKKKKKKKKKRKIFPCIKNPIKTTRWQEWYQFLWNQYYMTCCLQAIIRAYGNCHTNLQYSKIDTETNQLLTYFLVVHHCCQKLNGPWEWLVKELPKQKALVWRSQESELLLLPLVALWQLRSQNHRMVEFGGDLWSSGLNPQPTRAGPPRAGHSYNPNKNYVQWRHILQ